MSINAKNAIIAGLGAALIVGGWLAWKRHKENEAKMAEVSATVAKLIQNVPEFHKPSR